MKIAMLAATAASMMLLAGCGSKEPKAPEGGTAAVTPTAPTKAADPNDKTPGPPVTDASVAAAQAYAQSEEAKAALAGPAPQIAGVAKPALDNAAELAVCRIAFAVKHGDKPRAPSEVELRQSAYDMAANPKALEECRARP